MTKVDIAAVGPRSAAIVCAHVASGVKPICLAERSMPEDPADSGWQFLCGQTEEDWKKAQVWSIQEVLELEPSLREFIDYPAEITLVRDKLGCWWQK